ncbi:MAG TPA: hydrogenase maturation peptidase HycI [Candidatus Omnitrophota bacterium]|nr:hydrogenase maturation peptidase HycI [Candidatus Omnitrophota bacterium]
MGSDLRGDDAAGMLLAQKIEEACPYVKVIYGGTAPENFTGEIKKAKPDLLVIADSAEMNEPPGTVRLITPEEVGGYTFSTHALPLKVMIDFIRHDITCEVEIIAIQPATLKFGDPVSPAVADAVDELAEEIRDSLKTGPDSDKIREARRIVGGDVMKALPIGFEIAVATFLGAFIGYEADLRLRSAPVGLAVGVVAGAVAGLWNGIRIGLKIK